MVIVLLVLLCVVRVLVLIVLSLLVSLLLVLPGLLLGVRSPRVKVAVSVSLISPSTILRLSLLTPRIMLSVLLLSLWVMLNTNLVCIVLMRVWSFLIVNWLLIFENFVNFRKVVSNILHNIFDCLGATHFEVYFKGIKFGWSLCLALIIFQELRKCWLLRLAYFAINEISPRVTVQGFILSLRLLRCPRVLIGLLIAPRVLLGLLRSPRVLVGLLGSETLPLVPLAIELGVSLHCCE